METPTDNPPRENTSRASVDQRFAGAELEYLWWPESWIINWGPSAEYQVSFTHDGIREDEEAELGLAFDFARNIRVSLDATQALERFGGSDFHRRNYEIRATTSTSRLFSVGGDVAWGDAILHDRSNSYLGRGTSLALSATLRPLARFATDLNVATSRFHDVPAGNLQVFDARIVRSLSTPTVTAPRYVGVCAIAPVRPIGRGSAARGARSALLPG